MRKIYLLLSLLFFCVLSLFAQAPEKFTYQAVVRNATNQLVINAQVGVRVNILQGSATGNAVYSESHVTSSNANGLVTVNIGGGSVLHGSFTGIDWSDGPYFLKTDIDPNGGNDYTITSTQQLMSVPYALYAREAANGFSGDYNDLTNRPQIPQSVGELANDANYITLSDVPAQVNADWNATTGAAEILNKPTIPSVPTDVSAFNNDAGYITNSDIPAIPTVPTYVSAFTNDVGYLTSYTETDPQFNAWDKDYNDLINKPTIPTVPANVSAFNNDAGYITNSDIPAIPTVPTNVSAFMNDAGYITMDSIPTIPTNVSAFTNDVGYITNSDIPAIPTVPSNVSAFTNDAGYITSADIPSVPTNVSQLNNDAGYITAAQCGDVDICALVNLVQQLQSQVESLQSSLDSINNQGGQGQTVLPTVTTNTVTSIDSTSVTCGGNVTADGGAIVTTRGVCWSTSQNPTVSGSHTTDGSGTGSFTSSITGLTANSTYYVRAYATNSVGTAYGAELSFTTIGGGTPQDGQPCPGTPTVTDHEGNVYATVQIGDQCWMRDNLRTTTSPSTGTYLIPAANAIYTYTGKQAFWYNNDSATYAPINYGLLYNWNAAVDTFKTAYGETSVNISSSSAVSVTFSGHRRGICPAGWHLPSDAEWTQLTNYVSSQSEYTCSGNSSNIAKALASTEGWDSYSCECYPGDQSVTANNATGFSAVPAGRCYGSSFVNAGRYANFWSATQSAGYLDLAYDRHLDYDHALVGRFNSSKNYGYSVRCLRDELVIGTASLPTVTTNIVSNIAATSATCGGEVMATGGADVTARGVCWSTSLNPTVSGSHTTDGSGTGSFTSNITGLTANTTYYVRAYATNSVGTAYGAELSFTTIGGDTPQFVQPCPGTPTVTDHEGNVYHTVQIGNQCWTKENLRTTTSPSTGTYLIPVANANYTYTGKQARWYNNDSATYAPMNYGLLYNWNAAVDTFNTSYGETSVNMSSDNAVSVTFSGYRRGICPVGWHLPSDAEWNTMEATVSGSDWQTSYETSIGYRGNHAGKLAGGDNWQSSTTSGAPGDYGNADRNVSGFSAVPAGRCFGSLFDNVGHSARFWSATQNRSNYAYAYYRFLPNNYAYVNRNYSFKYYGRSVRCVRDELVIGTASLPTVTTNIVSNIAATSATCGGEVMATGGADVTARGVCWSTSLNPTVSGSHTTDGSGTGSFTSNITGLTANTTYYVRAYATNSVGTAYGAELSFTTIGGDTPQFVQSCPGTPTVTDHEGNVYHTVQIGNQCWTKENLRTTTSPSTGTYLIPVANANYTYTGKQARWYNNDSATYAPMNYGLLYNWNAAVDTFNTAYGETSVNTSSSNAVSVSFSGRRRGICPSGWHLPSDAEWNTMEATVSGSDWQTSYETSIGYRGNHAGKLAGGDNWQSSTTSGAPGDYGNADRNVSGFSAVPAGYCYGSSFLDASCRAYFWSATQGSSYGAYSRYLGYRYAGVSLNYNYYNYDGFSVRCVRD